MLTDPHRPQVRAQKGEQSVFRFICTVLLLFLDVTPQLWSQSLRGITCKAL